MVVGVRGRSAPAGHWVCSPRVVRGKLPAPTRPVAIALGAGTQTLTMFPWVVIFGPIGAADELPRTVLMTAAWVINLAVAEYVIRRRVQRPHRRSAGLGRSTATEALAA